MLGIFRDLAADTSVDAPFSYATRQTNLQAMAATPVDLLVVGGGITGAAIARDASMRGIRTALVEKGDFGSGTSSHSSRLVHGGLRYLEHGFFHLVFEASRERRILLHIAPHLVRPRSFLFPIHKGARVARWKLEAGLWLYDLLSLLRNVQRHQVLSKRKLLRAEPGLRSRGLTGGSRYWDAQCDDARLTLATTRDAARHGALAVNYAQVERLETADGRTRGARVVDLVTGDAYAVRAAVVVNATGPWTDTFRGDRQKPLLAPSKGAHVMVPRHRMGNREAITVLSPIDGRVMFIVPWNDLTYIGTTETLTKEGPDEVRASADDVIYLLRSANAIYPEARLTPDDVLSTWAGLRPLLRPPDHGDPGSASREHKVVVEQGGLISIVGGKLTTHRVMAADTVDAVTRALHELDGRPVPPPSPTHREPLPGGEPHDLDVLVDEGRAQGYSAATAEHLVHHYGSETPAVLHLANAEPALRQQIHPNHPAIRAELVHAMRREMAVTLGDLLIRRTHVFYEVRGHAAGIAAELVDLAAQEMGWDAPRQAAELRAYLHEVELNETFRNELRA